MSRDSFILNGTDMVEAPFVASNNALTRFASFLVSGGKVTDGGSLNASLASLVAFVDGRVITITTSTTVALADDDISWIWIENDGTVTDEVAGANPSNTSLLIAEVVTAGGSISSITHARNIGLDPDGTRSVTKSEIHIIAQSDQSISSNTTLTDDAELLFDMIDGEVWGFKFLLGWNATDAAASAGIKIHVATGAGSKLVLGAASKLSGIGGARLTIGVDYTSTMVLVDGVGWIVKGIIHATSNTTFKLRWAQNVSDADALIRKAKSTLTARRLVG